ncbi:MAG: hypothetical protein P0Y58_22320 [Candidatus Pseudomonas phytovorans]|uniref:Uncharacterized protein n=1 Tax=Candidatus Pseudomonas phytovorans TaxID=3121377 RepID=A0AAJ6BAV2_9PSED|nr:hypothetical protein [Pseudomonas sp.]WEK29602.1 MAG: hypothetical protein P0Y58_22320 [Pseudomonas sp.]
MLWSKEKALSHYNYLSGELNNPNVFFESKIGADLWIDGYDALASTNSMLFLHYLDIFESLYKEIARADVEQATGLYNALDSLLLVCAEAGEAEFMHALAVGICIASSHGVVPNIVSSQGVIINDTVVTLLSPNYRAIRLAAYNLGVVIRFQEEQDDRKFSPQSYRVYFGRPLAVKGRLWKCQFYNVGHEAGHIVYFGDGYLCRYGDQYETAQAFLAAEESLIGVDLLIYSELARFGHNLHCLNEFGGIDIATGERFDQRVAIEVAQDKNLTPILQDLLRRVALFELDVRLGRLPSKVCPDTEEFEILDKWVGYAARRKHIDGSIEMAENLFRRTDTEFGVIRNIRLYHSDNMSRARTDVFHQGVIYMDSAIPEIDKKARKKNLAQHSRRRSRTKANP